MGLDLYHMKTLEHENDLYLIECSENEPVFSKRNHFVSQKSIKEIDWENIFKNNNLNYSDYRLRLKLIRSESFVGIINEYKFVLANEFENEFAEVKLSFIDKNPFFDFKFFRKKNVIRGEFTYKSSDVNVIYCEEVGYQRYGVKDQFYSEFSPNAGVSDLETVLRMGEMVIPDAAEHFQSNFIQNWDTERSFVVVSW